MLIQAFYVASRRLREATPGVSAGGWVQLSVLQSMMRIAVAHAVLHRRTHVQVCICPPAWPPLLAPLEGAVTSGGQLEGRGFVLGVIMDVPEHSCSRTVSFSAEEGRA